MSGLSADEDDVGSWTIQLKNVAEYKVGCLRSTRSNVLSRN